MENNNKLVLNIQAQEQIKEFLSIQHIYDAGIREIKTKLEILDSEFKVRYDHNPIHHIESRLKHPDSIVKKAIKKNIRLTEADITANIFDIAGIRVICNYIDDVYTVAKLLIQQDDIKLIKMKDYIKNPKDNGYRSLHLVLEIPVFLSTGPKPICVEVQLRTIAMDFWASLEHKLRYKTKNELSEETKKELVDCANTISELDQKMLLIHQSIQDNHCK